jgi:hypothetical protein
MSHRTEPTPDRTNIERVDDAIRVLARLIARQAAAEDRTSQGDEDGPADDGVGDHGKE